MIEKLESMVKDLNTELEVYRKEVEDQKIDTGYEEIKLENYLGEELYETFKKYNVIIAGGAIASLFTNNEINDIDVYFRSKEDVAGFLAEMFDNYIIAHTKKATLFRYKKSRGDEYHELDVQAIHYKLFDSPQDVFNSFDFTVCMGAFDFKTGEFVFDKNFLKHNSQRTLRFHKGTDFPMMSLLRVKKYEDKYYRISKPEMVRIIMTCMNLDINSYEELKEQLGGMYGVNLDKLFPSDDKEEFDLSKAIDKLADLHLDKNYLVRPKNEGFTNVDDLIDNALGLKQKYFVHNDEKVRIHWDGTMSDEFYNIKDDAVEVDIREWFDPIVYKYVKQDENGRLFSFHDSSFEYKIDEVVEAKDDIGLFLGKQGEIKSFYQNSTGSILLKCKVELEDFNGVHNGYPTFKKCVPLETIGEPYKKDKLDMGLLFS